MENNTGWVITGAIASGIVVVLAVYIVVQNMATQKRMNALANAVRRNGKSNGDR